MQIRKFVWNAKINNNDKNCTQEANKNSNRKNEWES